MSEILRRIENTIASYPAAQMSNTKWRRVLETVGEIDIPVQFAFVREEEFKSTVHFPKDGCNQTSTKDCCAHGPFYYKEIFAIRCPVYEMKTNLKTGAKYQCTERSDRFLENLNSIGKLPTELDESFIYIKGYA